VFTTHVDGDGVLGVHDGLLPMCVLIVRDGQFQVSYLDLLFPRVEGRTTHLGVGSGAEGDPLVTSVEMGIEPTQESMDVCERLPVSLLASINFALHREGTTYSPVG
jgi:hypothetical protein